MRYLLGVEDWSVTRRRLEHNARGGLEGLEDRDRQVCQWRHFDPDYGGHARPLPNPPKLRIEADGPVEGGFPGLVPLLGLITPQPIVNLERAHEVADAIFAGEALVEMAFPPPPYPLEMRVSSDHHRGCTVISEDPNIVVSDVEWRQEAGFGVTVSFRKASPVLTVMEIGGRYIVRNGVHRIVGCLLAGLTEVPAFVVPMQNWPTSEGLFDERVVLGAHPPRVIEFLMTDRVVDVDWRTRQRIWRVTVDEFVVPGGGGTS